jgi:hypothetical protein
MVTREPATERGRRLASRDRADHPGATDRPCAIPHAHDPHPYGGILPIDDGLAHWCPGSPA